MGPADGAWGAHNPLVSWSIGTRPAGEPSRWPRWAKGAPRGRPLDEAKSAEGVAVVIES